MPAVATRGNTLATWNRLVVRPPLRPHLREHARRSAALQTTGTWLVSVDAHAPAASVGVSVPVDAHAPAASLLLPGSYDAPWLVQVDAHAPSPPLSIFARPDPDHCAPLSWSHEFPRFGMVVTRSKEKGWCFRGQAQAARRERKWWLSAVRRAPSRLCVVVGTMLGSSIIS